MKTATQQAGLFTGRESAARKDRELRTLRSFVGEARKLAQRTDGTAMAPRVLLHTVKRVETEG